MKATIKATGQTVTGANLKEIKRQMDAMLRIDGLRALTALTDTGTEIHVELYDGQDYIRTANGRSLS